MRYQVDWQRQRSRILWI